jgi:aspartate ammonia-lyase
MASTNRTERDFLGEVTLSQDCFGGIHHHRGCENFNYNYKRVNASWIHAMGSVKRACASVNASLGLWQHRPGIHEAIDHACAQMALGALDHHCRLEALQGGAGTSLNLAVNEILANAALVHLGHSPGRYDLIDPLKDLNAHQSTNDVVPTALRVAALEGLSALETTVLQTQEQWQSLERAFADRVKMGRTQLQDAVPLTLGQEMSAYAEAWNRDRWRLFKCRERLRVVNLGGTAIGTGIGAPKTYIFRVTDALRELTGLNLSRSENLVDATQNHDDLVEVSGMLKAHASTLIKVCNDLRLLSSGPFFGLGELQLPPRQAGSSIMAGKVNPVIPEACVQLGLKALANDQLVTLGATQGNLELNPFLPLMGDALLESLHYLRCANDILRQHCLIGLRHHQPRSLRTLDQHPALLTLFLSEWSYEEVAKQQTAYLDALSHNSDLTVRAFLEQLGCFDAQTIEDRLSPHAIAQLGSPKKR